MLEGTYSMSPSRVPSGLLLECSRVAPSSLVLAPRGLYKYQTKTSWIAAAATMSVPTGVLRICFIGTDKQSNFRPIAFHKNDLDFHAKELPTFSENVEFSLGPFLLNSSAPYTGNGLPLSHLSKNFLGWNSPHYWADPFLDSGLFAHIALVREGHPTIQFAIKVALHVDDLEVTMYTRLSGGRQSSTHIACLLFRKIHDAGGDHNQIGPGYNHHLLYDWRCGKVRIVDFTEGHKHPCDRQVPLKPYKAQFRYGPPLCPELTTLGLELGFGGPNTFLTEDAEVLDAIAFLDKYLEEHSGVSRQEALDAQEKYLKEEWRLVDPQVRRTE
ncbi:hypothetical protein EDD85DRAFT_1007488 [Armillaria nabsnona]|nr:hypothetical protein EDD85DRAFT_1007488 [Armillaria nabsnona]